MMEIFESEKIGNWTGVKINLHNAPFLILIAEKGFVMCGYLNIATAEKLGDAACMVTGVRDLRGMLNAKIVAATTKAQSLGIKEGMFCEEALILLS
jgi:uncharacterized protein YunC (DUF1805 family)